MLTLQGTGFGMFSDITRIVVESRIWTETIFAPGHEGVEPKLLTTGRIECKIPRASLCVGCGDSSMYDARMKGHFTEVGAMWTEDHHPLERDQMLCIVPAGVGNRLGAVVAVANQQGFHQNLFSYMRPSIETVSVQDACVESACGSLASREAFVFTASPAEGSVSSDRLLYLRGDNFGPAVAVQSKRGTESKDAARLNQDNQITVTYGGLKCQDVSVLAGGTLATCTIPAREPGAIGCAVEKVLVTVEGQVSAEFSKNSIVSLEPMPLVVPLNPNKKPTAWIDGDGAGMRIIFGRKPGATTWSPVRTNMGRPYRVRPGTRSDDFRLLCDASPQPVVADDVGGSCDALLVSLAKVPLVAEVPTIPITAPASMLGAGARCYWKSYAEFHVVFGYNALIAVNQNPPATLRLRPGVVFSYGAPSYSAETELLVETPATPFTLAVDDEKDVEPMPYDEPLHVFLEGEAEVGKCDKLVLTAFVSWASGSREAGLVFTWSSDPDLPVVRSASGETLESSRLEIPADDEDFDTATSYNITVKVRNWLGQEGTTYKIVKREDAGVPTTAILGVESAPNSSSKVYRDQMLVLGARAFLPVCVGFECTCDETKTVNDQGWNDASALLEVQWSLSKITNAEGVDVPGHQNTVLARQVGLNTQAVLVLEEAAMMTLETGHTYHLQIEAAVWIGFMTNNIQRFQTVANTQIQVQPKPPVVRLKHGNRYVKWGQGSEQEQIKIDASASFDPDGRSGDVRLRYSWYLDCASMFLKLPQTTKDKHGINRKAYLQACKTTELANKIVGKANEATEVDLEDGSKVVHYGVDTFDTFDLTEFNSGIPISDIQTLHPKECCDKPEGRNEMPLEIIIGVTLTDTDGASSSDAVSIMLTDKEMETPFAVRPLIGHCRSRQIPLACLRAHAHARFCVRAFACAFSSEREWRRWLTRCFMTQVGLEPFFSSHPKANERMIVRIDETTRDKHRQYKDNIKYIWSCDGASSHVPLHGDPAQAGTLNLPAGMWEGGVAYKISLTAVWQNGRAAETWVQFTAAQGPHGGTCMMSAQNGTSMVDSFDVACRLWTPADEDLLPLTYSFLVDLDGTADRDVGSFGELLLRDTSHSSDHKDWMLPSSRAITRDPVFGNMLCRKDCPVLFIAQIRDLSLTVTRWTTTLYLNRPGCVNAIAKCENSVMLDIIEQTLRSIDVMAADLSPMNALMTNMAIELSDIHLYGMNATSGFHATASLRSKSTGDDKSVSQMSHQEAEQLRRNSGLDIKRDLEREGLYNALAADIAEALDVDPGYVRVARESSTSSSPDWPAMEQISAEQAEM